MHGDRTICDRMKVKQMKQTSRSSVWEHEVILTLSAFHSVSVFFTLSVKPNKPVSGKSACAQSRGISSLKSVYIAPNHRFAWDFTVCTTPTPTSGLRPRWFRWYCYCSARTWCCFTVFVDDLDEWRVLSSNRNTLSLNEDGTFINMAGER